MRRCVGVDTDTFAADYWDTAPLLTRAAQLPQDFTDLLSPDDVDGLITQRGLRAPFFRMVQDGKTVTGATRKAVAGSRTISDLVDAEQVRRLHDEGATLVLQSLHRMWPPIIEFCRDLAAGLGHPTQCNAYVTPGGNARGFAYHHDTHDVFVLQVAGSKRWQVHQPVVPLPTSRQPRSGADLVSSGQPPLLDVELRAGDALYLPRGYVHAAQTTDEASVHLTVGVLVTTWHDVLRDVVALAADELHFRHALPVDPLQMLESDSDVVAGVVQQAAAWLADLPTDRVLELVEKRLSKAVAPEPIGMLAQGAAASACTLATRSRPRVGLRWSLDVREGRCVLTLPDRAIDLPAFTEPAVRRLLSERCAVGDLVAGELDDAGAVVLVRRMLREGAIVAVRS